MAARENQGYLIAVIILVLLTLVLALLTFLGWSKANEYSEGIANAKADLAGAQKLSEAHQIEAEILRAYVGDLGESVAEVQTKIDSANRLSNSGSISDAQKTAIQNVVIRINEVKDAYARDMQQFIFRTEEDEAEDLTWTGVLRNLIAVTADKHNELSVQREENKEDRLTFESDKKKLEDQLAQSEKNLREANENLQTEKKDKQEIVASLTDQLGLAKKAIDKLQEIKDKEISMLRTENAEFADSNSKLKIANEDLTKTKQELTRENFDIHDGKIVRVARTTAGNLVFLNIGSWDGLRTNQTFAVYDRNVNNFEKGQHKAKIEVIRITGPKSADARITEENPIDPITRDDLVVTPTWDPGHRNEIAIAGIIDLDGDGVSDRLRFIRMIENNGGKVVAQHDESGKITGEINSSTRYLVMGDPPKPGPGEDNSAIYNAIRELEGQATDNTVRVIEVRQMLNRMGRHLTRVYRTDPKIQDQPLGIDSSGERAQGSGNRN